MGSWHRARRWTGLFALALAACGTKPAATRTDLTAAAAPLRQQLRTVLTAFGAGATAIPDTYQQLPRMGGGDVQAMWFAQLRLKRPPDAPVILDRRIGPALTRAGWSARDWSSPGQINRSFQSPHGTLAISLSRAGPDMVIGATGPTLTVSPDTAASLPQVPMGEPPG